MADIELGSWIRNLARACILLFVCAVTLPAWSQSLEDKQVEKRVKAAFLYKFTSYVEWPKEAFPSSDSPFTIAVLGDDLLADELNQVIAGRSVEGRRLTVKRLKDGESPAGVHILFIGHGEIARLSQITGSAPLPILVVTESSGALERGSIINFAVVGGRVRFDISLGGADKRGLKLSSRLLTVAQSVRQGTP